MTHGTDTVMCHNADVTVIVHLLLIIWMTYVKRTKLTIIYKN